MTKNTNAASSLFVANNIVITKSRTAEIMYPPKIMFLMEIKRAVNGPIIAPTKQETDSNYTPTFGVIFVLLNTAFDTIGITGTPAM